MTKRKKPQVSDLSVRERLLLKAINDRLRKQRVQGDGEKFQLLEAFIGSVVKKDGRFDQMAFVGGEWFKLIAVLETNGDLVFKPTEPSNCEQWHVNEAGAVKLMPDFGPYWTQLRNQQMAEIENVVSEGEEAQMREVLDEARKINPAYGEWA